jgi:predicted ArsR family transcriptional regulator
MRDCGYEPTPEGKEIRLRNCPYSALARQHRELVCGMNRALLEGLVAGIGDELEAVLEPRADECCVALRRPVSTS